MKVFLTIIGLILFNILFSQNPQALSLENCRAEAVKNYPLTKQLELYSSSSDLELVNIKKNYLPNIEINGQASYQSEVTEIPINMPGVKIPSLSKDWYKITMNVNQMIFDANLTKTQKEINQADLLINKQNVEIELYKLKERVNSVFFSIILLKEKSKLLDVFKDEIQEKLSNVRSGVNNGVLLSSEENVLKAELLKIEQQVTEVETSLSSLVKVLSQLTSIDISINTELLLPKIQITPDLLFNNRLEYRLLDLHKQKIQSLKEIVNINTRPKIFGFGQLGYGRPGLNMLSDNFDTYYIIGAKLSWSPWDWKKSENQNKILDIQSDIIESQKETYDKNFSISLETAMAEIVKFKKLIQKDQEIIDLRKQISKTASARFDNGVISSTDLITELNTETQAKLNLQTHILQLIQAKINVLAIIGEL
ncbi:MAG: TolC family protein [Bacteroidales bacterium]|nr:TolC family protein [Bacteroidales bacterium]